MKRLLALIAVAAVAVALYATTAPGGQQAVTPAQFNALKKQVAKLQTTVKDLTTAANVTFACAFDKGAIAMTSSPTLHVTSTGEAASFWALTTNNADCVRFINETPTSTSFKRLQGSFGP
jgi:hypothetical protein